MTRYALLFAIVILGPILAVDLLPSVHACGTCYSLNPVPVFAQEGYTITLVLTVTGASPATLYSFVFFVRDPSSKTYQSLPQNFTTFPSQTSFSMLIVYPSTSFPGSNSLVGQYVTWVDQVRPNVSPVVASNSFFFILTDTTEYQRTQTVGIHASGYNASETVTVTIRTQTTSTLVFSQTMTAAAGIIATGWKIPRNATIDNYVVTLTGTSTKKSPPDVQGFPVRAATMSISSLSSTKTTYQRTETMTFSFQAMYPDGSIASTGVALLILSRPDRVNITLTSNYDSATQNFAANYKTSPNNQTGTWTATLASNAYGDGYGNTGPGTQLKNSPQLLIATFNFNVNATTYVPTGQQVRLNATVTYPDGTFLQSGSVGAFLLYTGFPTVNDTVPLIFDSSLQKWVGFYSPQPTDPGGLYSLTIRASDNTVPPNTGFATKAVTLQDKPPVVSFSPSPTTAKTGQTVSLSITASDPDGSIANTKVDWGDGTVDTLAGAITSDSHAYTSTGSATSKIYTITITVTDNGGQTTTTTSTVIVQLSPTSSPSGDVSFPLYYFGILAALIAALLAGGFLAFRRHKVTHARLKIDLEAVKSEAGRIENQEFFQSVKDQLKKDKDD